MSQLEFVQSIPSHGDWKLAGEYNKPCGHIDYRESESGRVVRVPNIWYNQPVAARIATMEWYVARDKEALTKHAPDSLASKQLVRNIAALESKAMEMRITGEVLA